MQTINVINNIVLKDGILHAYGREGNVTRVFLRQGIKKLKGQFNHCTTRGYSLRELRIKLLRSFNNKIPVDVYVIRNRDKDNLKKIHDMIMAQIDIGYSVQLVAQIDIGYSVQLAFWNPKRKYGHSVVAIGYTLFGTTLRLFCLDSACPLPYASIWNNVIDVNIDYDDVDKLDFNHQANEKVLVDAILLIDDWKWQNAAILPFEPEENNSILPF